MSTTRHDIPAATTSRGAARRADTAGGSLLGYVDYLRILHRRRRVAILAFVLVTLPTLLLTLTAEPVYEAVARVRVGLPLPVVADDAPPPAKTGMNDYVQLFRSREVARRALEDVRLSGPLFGAGHPLKATAARLAGSLWPVNATAAAEPVAPPRDDPKDTGVSVDALLSHLSVTAIPESRLIDVRVAAANPGAAAALANAIVARAINQELDVRLASSAEISSWFNRQLEEQRARLASSEAALQTYKEDQNALAVEDRQNIVVQKLSDLNAAVTRAKTDRIAKESLYRQAEALATKPEALDTLPGAANSTYVRQLKDELAALMRRRATLAEEYGELHPEMVTATQAIADTRTRLNAELAKIGTAARNYYEAAVAQERRLVAALEAQKTEALDLNRKTLDYAALQREATGNRELYEQLLQQAKASGLTSELRAADIAVVETAEPPTGPARPARLLNTAASLGGGVFAAIGLALLMEFCDRRVRTPDQIKRDLALPYLGYVPLVRMDGDDAAVLLTAEVPARFKEAVRRVRANVMLSSAAEGCRTLVVTSTSPREGKTLVSCNLGLALAQSGARVVLVDADMRRSRVHTHLGLEAGPGLAEVLTGGATLDGTLRSTAEGLRVLLSGAHPPNPAELISSARYRDLVAELQRRFDWVIVDSPPVMAVADAALLAQHATGIVFVVAAEMAPTETVREAVDQLAAVPVPVLGALLNRVDVERNGFYYSKYYNPDYESYYA
jgi:succinoglycan biosynthesis transport protein ExoP